MRCVAGAAPRPLVEIGVGVVAEAEDEVAWAISEGLAGVNGAALGARLNRQSATIEGDCSSLKQFKLAPPQLEESSQDVICEKKL